MYTTSWPVAPPAQLTIGADCPVPGTARVAATGEIDLSSSGVLHVRLLNVLATLHPHRIEVDLAGVTFLDCSGLTVLVDAGKAAARAGCCLRITNPRPLVRRILDLTGLLDALTAGCDQPPPVAATVTVSAGVLVAGRCELTPLAGSDR
ncbi:MAG TPA: STAS domain-containing protein [Actinoplanes sp.]|jgi:anti-anti-sigma factor|nr:STAS domain-containing protein [Actinoplanes sp.]